MALYINTNIWSLNAQRALATSQADLTRALERLSTSLRINRASDDPTGHAVVERYTSQINGVDQSKRNVSHGTVFAQHAESNLESIKNLLSSTDPANLGIRELIVKANVSTLSVQARQILQDEIVMKMNEVERIAQTTEFDGRKILNNSTTNTIFQVGPNAADTVSVATNDFRVNRFGVNRLLGNGTGTNSGGVRGAGGESIIIDGYVGQEKVSIPAAGTGGASAKEIAKAVNAAQAGTGVSALARTDLEIVGWAKGSYVLQLDSANAGTPFTFAVLDGILPGTVDLSGMVTAYNASSTRVTTGIEMSLNADGQGVILTSAAGDNITVTLPAGANPAGLPNTLILKPTNFTGATTGAGVDGFRVQTLANTLTSGSRAFTGQVVFDSERPFTIISEPVPLPTAAPFYPDAGLVLKEPTVKTLPRATESSTPISLSTIDVTTGPTSIRDAFAIVDGALASVATQRAALGSTQNRFNSIIDNLSNDFVNLTTARGYIQDADIALESSIQTRASIQNQVNIAILGQANALQQAVLALLR